MCHVLREDLSLTLLFQFSPVVLTCTRSPHPSLVPCCGPSLLRPRGGEGPPSHPRGRSRWAGTWTCWGAFGSQTPEEKREARRGRVRVCQATRRQVPDNEEGTRVAQGSERRRRPTAAAAGTTRTTNHHHNHPPPAPPTPPAAAAVERTTRCGAAPTTATATALRGRDAWRRGCGEGMRGAAAGRGVRDAPGRIASTTRAAAAAPQNGSPGTTPTRE